MDRKGSWQEDGWSGGPSDVGPLWPIRRIVGGTGGAVYLVREREPLLVDAGSAGDAPRILAALESSGLRPRDLRYIVLTHHHLDHAGGAAALREATGAELLAHAADTPYVEGRLQRPRPAGTVAALKRWWLARSSRPAHVDRRLLDGDDVGGLTVVHTPGHTRGSLCLYYPRRRALFVGDVLRTVGSKTSRLAEMPHSLTENLAQSRRSIMRVAGLDVEAIYPAHGEAVYSAGGKQLRELASRLRQAL
jgi:glyoxylase-like metal-dependent hydrolase (beta-lactamase superfamily II)